MQHELAHIHAGHRYDLLLLQTIHILFWISPSHWLLRKELKTVHEFEADEIASKGIDKSLYATLLLSQSLDSSHSFLIAQSFFNHPLKRRIMMLQKMKFPKKTTLLFVAYTLTAAFTGVALLAQTKKQVNNIKPAEVNAITKANSKEGFSTRHPLINGEIKILNDCSIAFERVEQMPRFDGNLYEWLSHNIQYPKSTEKHNEEDRLILEFTVGINGQILRPRILQSSGNQTLDDEVMRAINNMPAWKPGIQNGNPVPVYFTLPVTFGSKGRIGGC